MKIYVLVNEDRHISPDIRLFLDKEQAIEMARRDAKEYGGDQYSECVVEGWLFYATYSSEGDCFYIVEKDVY